MKMKETLNDNDEKHLIVAEQEQILGKSHNLLTKKEAEFVFPGGYSEERTEEEILNENLTLDEFGQPLIENPDLIEQYEHDWALYQDNALDLSSSRGKE